MAEELHAGVSGENWWINSSRRGLMESPCSVGLNDLGSFGWPITDHVMAMKTKYSISNSVSDQSSLSFQDIINDDQKPNQHQHSGSISIDSTLQMMGFGLSTTSSPISNFNQANLLNSKEDINNNNFQSMFQEDMETKLNYRPEIGLTASLKLQNEWSTTPNSSSYSFGYSTCTNSNTSTSTSTSTSKLLQGPFDGESQPQQSLCNINNNNNNNNNYNKMSSTTISSSFAGLFSSNSFMRPSVPKQLQHSGFQISNNTTTVPFWNYSASNGLNDIRGASFPPSQSHFLAPTSFKEKPTFHILNSKGTRNQEIQDSRSVVKKSGNDIYQPVMKRPRIETHSPLPTFKVRKEKLGDRITALQQLVSPFGKTDTASVLQEAIDYIKFLLDQVGILSTPYLKNGASCSNIINQQQEGSDNLKEPDCPKQDLKSRGLCLVPISSTFPFSNETTADFWTPTFGSSFR